MRRMLVFVPLLAAIVVIGCTDKETPKANKESTTTAAESKVAPKHAGYWCGEHGIPEDDCLMCKFSEEELKKKGDWCEKHDYAKSQCFGCDPKLKERYAAQYRARFKKDPPEPTDNPPTKNPEK